LQIVCVPQKYIIKKILAVINCDNESNIASQNK